MSHWALYHVEAGNEKRKPREYSILEAKWGVSQGRKWGDKNWKLTFGLLVERSLFGWTDDLPESGEFIISIGILLYIPKCCQMF